MEDAQEQDRLTLGSSSDSESDTVNDTATTSTTESADPKVVSLLDRPKSPSPSILSRKRRVHCKPPRGGKKSVGGSKSDPKAVTPLQRVHEFNDEQPTVSACRLFCKACRETLSTKHSIVHNHVKSRKHADSKKKMQSKVAREADIARALITYDDKVYSKGETLSEEQRVYRVQILTTF